MDKVKVNIDSLNAAAAFKNNGAGTVSADFFKILAAETNLTNKNIQIIGFEHFNDHRAYHTCSDNSNCLIKIPTEVCEIISCLGPAVIFKYPRR